jgi:hypothetical protein
MKTPALDAWRRELAAGTRTPYTFDPLWRAACEERNALEHAQFPELAESFLAESRRIIRAAQKRRRVA